MRNGVGANGFVTWKNLISVQIPMTIGTIALLGGLASWAWNEHTERPHAGTATIRQLSDTKSDMVRSVDKLEQRIEKLDGNMEAKFKSINSKVDISLSRIEGKLDRALNP